MFDYTVVRYTPADELAFLKRLYENPRCSGTNFSRVVELVKTREYPGWQAGEREMVYARGKAMLPSQDRQSA